MHECAPRLPRARQALVGSRRPSEAPFRYSLEDLRSIGNVASPDNNHVGAGGKGGCAAPQPAAEALMVVSLVPAAAVTAQFRIFCHLRWGQYDSGRQISDGFRGRLQAFWRNRARCKLLVHLHRHLPADLILNVRVLHPAPAARSCRPAAAPPSSSAAWVSVVPAAASGAAPVR